MKLDDIYNGRFPSIKEIITYAQSSDTRSLVKKSAAEVVKNINVIMLAGLFPDLIEKVDPFRCSAERIYCSRVQNKCPYGDPNVSVLKSESGPVYVYMYTIVEDVPVYTNSPYLLIGNKTGDKFHIDKDLYSTMDSMGLADGFRKQIENIIIGLGL